MKKVKTIKDIIKKENNITYKIKEAENNYEIKIIKL